MTNLHDYRQRADAIKLTADEQACQLLEDLLRELESLNHANERLRKSLSASRKSSGMSSKLRDALYE
ncbi:Ni2+-binding GTPase [Paenibacillus sp. SC116]|uniref:Ni2+-binding GTPase n=1 Tax=Paenibacillus sp. SC116 TaxID=2968986 RepID=UPI00215A313B|nr:Ni2+-binding GTPase [Paenibacillus sp. SC116]MCR8845425.1 Ni2+-binding GTPase [Paenibacillus sp. SC116]